MEKSAFWFIELYSLSLVKFLTKYLPFNLTITYIIASYVTSLPG